MPISRDNPAEDSSLLGSHTCSVDAAAILEVAPDPIVIVDEEGTMTLANHQAENVFGYARTELIGQPVEVLMPNEFRRQHVRERRGYAKAPRIRPMGGGLDIQVRRKDGTVFPADISLSPLRVGQRLMVVAIIRDITERKSLEEHLQLLSSHDVLTGLYNRAFFEQQLPAVEHRRRFPLSIVVLDVDGLKQLNDTEGHAAGDELLRRMATVLRAAFRAEDVVARVGGDEFSVLLSRTDTSQLQAILLRLERKLQQHNAAIGARPLCFSFGSATAHEGDSLTDVLRAADMQMYERKRRERARLALTGE